MKKWTFLLFSIIIIIPDLFAQKARISGTLVSDYVLLFSRMKSFALGGLNLSMACPA
jgi:hypothetical protein